eukprot:1622855-Pleurochrysis_carterae.AAC.1
MRWEQRRRRRFPLGANAADSAGSAATSAASAASVISAAATCAASAASSIAAAVATSNASCAILSLTAAVAAACVSRFKRAQRLEKLTQSRRERFDGGGDGIGCRLVHVLALDSGIRSRVELFRRPLRRLGGHVRAGALERVRKPAHLGVVGRGERRAQVVLRLRVRLDELANHQADHVFAAHELRDLVKVARRRRPPRVGVHDVCARLVAAGLLRANVHGDVVVRVGARAVGRRLHRNGDGGASGHGRRRRHELEA